MFFKRRIPIRVEEKTALAERLKDELVNSPSQVVTEVDKLNKLFKANGISFKILIATGAEHRK